MIYNIRYESILPATNDEKVLQRAFIESGLDNIIICNRWIISDVELDYQVCCAISKAQPGFTKWLGWDDVTDILEGKKIREDKLIVWTN
jgi:hypothetical protein